MSHSTLPGTGPWSWLEPGLWVYRARELDLLGQADELLADAAPAARAGGAALLEAKRRLHAAGVGAATAPAAVGGGGHRFVVQVAIQFLAGYRDLNLRDAAHVGHGAVLCHDPEWHGRRELAAVIRGALVGLAATEEPVRPAGEPTGSDLAAVATRAVRTAAGWEITGRKAWVSRVLEADAFVVFARSPEHLERVLRAGRLARAVHHAGARPAGRRADGWSWGELSLQRVPVPASAVLGAAVGGVAVFRRHFAEYRPLVAATCLGAAAAAVDGWVERVLSGDRAHRRRPAARRGRGAARRPARPGAGRAGRAVHRHGPAGRHRQLVVEDGQGAGGADRDRGGPRGRARDAGPAGAAPDAGAGAVRRARAGAVRLRGRGRRAGVAAALGRGALRAVFGGDPGRDLRADLDDAAAAAARLTGVTGTVTGVLVRHQG